MIARVGAHAYGSYQPYRPEPIGGVARQEPSRRSGHLRGRGGAAPLRCRGPRLAARDRLSCLLNLVATGMPSPPRCVGSRERRGILPQSSQRAASSALTAAQGHLPHQLDSRVGLGDHCRRDLVPVVQNRPQAGPRWTWPLLGIPHQGHHQRFYHKKEVPLSGVREAFTRAEATRRYR